MSKNRLVLDCGKVHHYDFSLGATMKHFSLVMLVFCSTFSRLSDASTETWKIKSMKERVVTFANGQTFEIELVESKVLGQVKAGDGIAPYMIMSGRVCDDCGATIGIFIHSPSQGKMKGQMQMKYSYPGNLWSCSKEPEIVEKSRAFYGKCMQSFEGVLWIKDKKSSTTWNKSIFAIKPRGMMLHEDTLPFSSKLEEEILKKVKNNECFEIQGKDSGEEC